MMKWVHNADRVTLTKLGIGLAAISFVAVNVFSNAVFTDARLDLTEDGLYTVTDGTKQVLAAIDEPIDVRFYYSRKLDELGPYFANHAQRVDELMADYERRSNGMLRVTRFDPEPYSREEDLAVADGVEGLPVSGDGSLAYFGLAATNSTDDRQSIAYLAPEKAGFLEYDLTKLVNDLANPDKPVVGLVGDLPLMGGPATQYQPWQVVSSLRDFVELRQLGGDFATIDEEIAVLLLAQPQTHGQTSLYAIDQFVMRGGRILAFVDPLAETMQQPQPGMPPVEDSAIETLAPLLASWGVSIDSATVVGDLESAMQVQAYVNGRQAIVQYLPWLQLGAAQMAAEDVITGGLQVVNLNSAGHIQLAEGATTTLEPLLLSSALNDDVAVDEIRMMPDPAKLLGAFEPIGEPRVIAARISGTASSAFADGAPEGVENDAHLAVSEVPINVVLVADADMLADRNWVRTQSLLGQQFAVTTANNADFVVNAIDNLRGSQGLIALRGRGLTDRPFEVIEAMERNAEQQFRAKEQQLLAEIDDTRAQIEALQKEEQETGIILTAAQQQEIDDFRAAMLDRRQELREVQRSLRQDVDRLEGWLRAANIWAMPALVGVVAVVLALFRRWRAGRHQAASG